MIVMTYACTKCKYATPILDNAQQHADTTKHHVGISGSITPRPIPLASHRTPEAIERKARETATEAAILRAARDRGLLKDGVRK